MKKCIPFKKCSTLEHSVAGWNDAVAEKHDMARSAFIDWMIAGKPRMGYEFDLMRHTRSKFKLALRYCKLNEESLRCDSLARDFLSKPGDFWKKVKKQSNSKNDKICKFC